MKKAPALFSVQRSFVSHSNLLTNLRPNFESIRLIQCLAIAFLNTRFIGSAVERREQEQVVLQSLGSVNTAESGRCLSLHLQSHPHSHSLIHFLFASFRLCPPLYQVAHQNLSIISTPVHFRALVSHNSHPMSMISLLFVQLSAYLRTAVHMFKALSRASSTGDRDRNNIKPLLNRLSIQCPNPLTCLFFAFLL
jgi:hypothetical protein